MDEDNFICQEPTPTVSKKFWKGLFWGIVFSIPIWMVIIISIQVLMLEGK